MEYLLILMGLLGTIAVKTNTLLILQLIAINEDILLINDH